ncbi:MAG TPA: hypothetical protein VGK47_09300 [Nitrososphaeraceae archaeon]
MDNLKEIQDKLLNEIDNIKKKFDEIKEKKPQMSFYASLSGRDIVIKGACPHAIAWLESMGKMSIKPNELHWVGKMGIEVCMVKGEVKRLQREIGRDKIDRTGLLTGKFDALDKMR